MERLMKQTGLDKLGIRRIRIKNLVCHRVVNQTRMGKIQSQYFLTIAGNQAGMLGIGEGKAAEPEDGRRQAMMAAIRNMKPVPRYEDRTIFGEVQGKVGASVVKLFARGPGKSMRLVILWKYDETNFLARLWKSLPASHIRDGSRCRALRSLCSYSPFAKPHERRQSHLRCAAKPTATGRRCSCSRKEDG